jgi:hypothetical protein
VRKPMAADLPSAERTNRHWLNQFGAPKAEDGSRLSLGALIRRSVAPNATGVSLARPPALH